MDSRRDGVQADIYKEGIVWIREEAWTQGEKENTYVKVDVRRKRRKGRNPCVENMTGAGLQEVTEAELYVKSVWEVVWK